MKKQKFSFCIKLALSFSILSILIVICGCSPSEKALVDQLGRELRDAIVEEAGEISKTAVSNVEEVAKTQAAALQATAKAALATQMAEVAARLDANKPQPWDTSWLPEDQELVVGYINNIISGTGMENTGSAILQDAFTYGVNPAFALAMFRKEASFAKVGTIAYANNNPGNIIATGGCRGLVAGSACNGNYGEISTNGRFGVYSTMQDGVSAYFMLLNREYKPGTKRNCEDINCIINAYAPPPENNTSLYIQQITGWTKDYQQKLLGQ